MFGCFVCNVTVDVVPESTVLTPVVATVAVVTTVVAAGVVTAATVVVFAIVFAIVVVVVVVCIVVGLLVEEICLGVGDGGRIVVGVGKGVGRRVVVVVVVAAVVVLRDPHTPQLMVLLFEKISGQISSFILYGS